MVGINTQSRCTHLNFRSDSVVGPATRTLAATNIRISQPHEADKVGAVDTSRAAVIVFAGRNRYRREPDS